MDRIELALAIVKKEEGWRAHPYRDSVGLWTIGYGSRLYWDDAAGTLNADESLVNGLEISKEFGEVMARNRIGNDCDVLSGLGWFDWLSAERQAVVLAMSYQLGVGGTFGFKRMIGALGRMAYDGAAKEMLNSAWARQTPARAKRMAEAMMTGNLDYWRAE